MIRYRAELELGSVCNAKAEYFTCKVFVQPKGLPLAPVYSQGRGGRGVRGLARAWSINAGRMVKQWFDI